MLHNARKINVVTIIEFCISYSKQHLERSRLQNLRLPSLPAHQPSVRKVFVQLDIPEQTEISLPVLV